MMKDESDMVSKAGTHQARHNNGRLKGADASLQFRPKRR